jgi:membrane associated rhomboid family serine protease
MEQFPPQTELEMEEMWRPIPPELAAGQVIQTLTSQQAQLWALVLHARAIPSEVHPNDTGWQLCVPPAQFSRAIHELQQFTAENRNWPPPAPPARALAENTLATLSVLILLATFHNLTLLDISLNGHNTINWLTIGAAQAEQIRNGEWWRLITALTLHANLPHLLSNLAIGGFIILCLCRELGAGLAWSLLLASGISGNLINAYVQPAHHSSVGASTVVFGAVGLLAALNFIRAHTRWTKRWGLPLAGAMALLAALGTEGERTDLGAHLFGCLSGVCIGIVTAWLVERYGQPSRAFSAFLALLSATVVIAAWWLALYLNGYLSA